MPTPKLRFMQNMSELVRKDTLDDVEYLVCPVILIREGVWNGLYYPAEELSKFPESWNGRDVPIFHPQDLEGNSVSAGDPAIIEQHGIGRLFAVQWDEKLKALKGEIWLNPAKAQQTEGGKAVLAKLEANEMIEVSTGLFVELDKTPGEFNGAQYTAIALNYRPDHLAVLPGAKGACSVEDGAGTPRVNRKQEEPEPEVDGSRIMVFLSRMMEQATNLFANKDKSLDARRDKLRKLIIDKFGSDKSWTYIEDMLENTVVFVVEADNKPSKHMRIGYTVDKKGVPSLSAEMPVEVEPVTEYRPVENQQEQGDRAMNREEVIAKLIANGQFEEADKSFLEGLTDERLSKFAAPVQNTTETPETGAKAADTPASGPAPDTKPEKPVENKDKTSQVPVTAEDFLKTAPPDVRAVLEASVALRNNKRASLIEGLVANARCRFPKESLERMSDHDLENLATLAQVEVSFEGNDAGEADDREDVGERDGGPMPVINWTKDGGVIEEAKAS